MVTIFVIVGDPLDVLLCNDVFKLRAVETEPIEGFITFKGFGSAAGEIVALAAAFVREDCVSEGDILELLVRSRLVGFGSLVCELLSVVTGRENEMSRRTWMMLQR